jgi:hypothetical protein
MECPGILVEMDKHVLAEVHTRESSLQEIPKANFASVGEIVIDRDLVKLSWTLREDELAGYSARYHIQILMHETLLKRSSKDRFISKISIVRL